MELFDYQREAEESLRDGFRAGHRCQMLYMATGAGKSVVALSIIAQAESRGSRVAFLTERVALSEQFSRHLDRASIEHGILQADHWRYRPHERVQVCSQQTLESRGWPEVDLVVVDEAHVARKRVTAWLARTGAKVIGLSATPFTKGLGLTYTNLVSPITTNALIERKRLVRLRVFAGVEADLRGAKKTASEWQAEDVASRSIPIVGNITAEWVKHAHQFGNPQRFKTFLFSPTVEYGERLCEKFNALGHRFVQISYLDADMKRREAYLSELNDPDSDLCGIVSVDALGRGVDVPNVRCVDMCRPFRKSFMAFTQQLGRGMRVADGKDHVTILDHAGNCVRFGDDLAYLFENGCHSMDDGRLADGVRKDKKPKERKEITCACGAVLMPWDKHCPACGKERQRSLSRVIQVDGELRAFKLAQRRNAQTSTGDKRAWYAAFRTYGKLHGYKDGWAAHKYRERFSEFPHFGEVGYGEVFPEAQGYIKHREIAYRNRKEPA